LRGDTNITSFYDNRDDKITGFERRIRKNDKIMEANYEVVPGASSSLCLQIEGG